MSKYAMIINGKINIIVANEEYANSHDEIITIPDEVHQNWEVTQDGKNAIQPEVFEDIRTKCGRSVGKICVEKNRLIPIGQEEV